MKLKRLKKSTCFAFGMAGAVLALLAGVLMMLGFGEAQYAHMAAFILTGAMILMLATREKGAEKRGLRTRLLVLFFLLLLGNLRLPPMDFLEAAALPLLSVLYHQKGDAPLSGVLLLFEVALALLRTLAAAGYVGHPAVVVGAALAGTAIIRFLLLLRQNRRAAASPDNVEEVHNLR